MDIINETNEMLTLDERIKLNFYLEDCDRDRPTDCELYYNTQSRLFNLSNSRGAKDSLPDGYYLTVSFTPNEAIKLQEALDLFFEKYEWHDNPDEGVITE